VAAPKGGRVNFADLRNVADSQRTSIEFITKPNAQNVVVQSDVALRMLKSGNSCLQPIVIAVQ
jgi:hypothetical protein